MEWQRLRLSFVNAEEQFIDEEKRYDGTLESLKDKSRRPHAHLNQHTEDELKLIRNYKNNNKETGLVVLRVKLRCAGYTRTIQDLYHAMQRMRIYKKSTKQEKKWA